MRFGKSVLALLASLFLLPVAGRAQNPDTIAPERSAEMAKRITNQLIQALGGPLYLSMAGRQCDGRRALIGHSGELAGYISLKDSWQYPDKDRIDYIARSRNTLLGFIIGVQDLDITHGGMVTTLFLGDSSTGWVMDRSGVAEMPADSVSQFQAGLKQNVDNLLRIRIKDEGINYRWGGLGTVDLHPIDWVEISDADGYTVKLAVDKSTHLLVRSVVVTEDTEFNQPREDVTIYSNYQTKGGIQIPMQVTKERDGRRLQQVFFDECRPNPGLPTDFFTKEGLEKHYKEVGAKNKPAK